MLCSSTHFGAVSANETAHILTFSIDSASYPNWEGTVQKRPYELVGDQLSYQVPAAADGVVPVSVWKRVR